MVETLGSWFSSQGTENHGGLDEYKGWTYACVRSISEKVGGIELILKKRNGDETEVVSDHALLDFLGDANPFLTAFDIISSTQAYLELEGSAFWWVARKGGDKGEPVSIWVLRPDFVTVVPDEENFVKEYRYKIGNKTFTLSTANVIPFREFNPKDPFKGLGTTYAAASSINADNYAREWQKAFFKNGARIDGVITKDGDMSPEEYKAINTRWNDKYRGADKAHKTAILSNGLKYQAIGATATDMDFVNLRTMSRDEILAMFRVPKTVLGVTDGTQTRATAETSEYVYMKETIRPKMQKFTRTVNEYLLPMFELNPRQIFFTFVDPVPENRELALSTYANGLQYGWMAVNEVRAREGLDPVENGDAPRVGFGTEPLGDPIKTAKRVSNAKPRAKSATEKLAIELAAAIAPAFKEIADQDAFEKQGEKVWKAQVKRGESYEKKLAKIMDEYFEDAQDRILENYDDAFKKNVKATKAAANSVVDPEEEADEIVKMTKKFFNVLVEAEGEAALEDLGMDGFDIRNERVQAALNKTIAKFAGEVSDHTQELIRKAIADGLDEGEDVDQIRKRIETSTAFDRARSEVIARTETSRAQNFATVTAWKESDVVEGKVWYTALDERVEEECAALHGTEYGLDDDIDAGDQGLLIAPPLHPNCRCTLLPVVKSKGAHQSETKEFDPLKDMAELDAIEKQLDDETL